MSLDPDYQLHYDVSNERPHRLDYLGPEVDNGFHDAYENNPKTGYLIEYPGPLSGPKAKALGKLLVPILALLLIGFFGNEWLHAAACVAACVLTHTWDGAVSAWRKDKA